MVSCQRHELLTPGGEERVGADEKRTGALLDQGCERSLGFALVVGVENNNLPSNGAGRGLHLIHLVFRLQKARIYKQCNQARTGNELA